MLKYGVWVLLFLSLGGAAQAGLIYYMDDATNTLMRMDPSTHATAAIGATGVGGDFGDLAYNTATGTLYWIPGRGNNSLYTLNVSTGQATLVGAHGINDLFALGYNPVTGQLYAESSTFNFYSITMGTGAATLIGANTAYPGGLTYDSSRGSLVLTEAGTGAFYTVDASTGATTLLGAQGYVNDGGVAYDADRNVFWVDDWNGNIFSYDATTFSRTPILTGQGSLDGIVYIPDVGDVPEPATVYLLAGGVGLLLLRRRR